MTRLLRNPIGPCLIVSPALVTAALLLTMGVPAGLASPPDNSIATPDATGVVGESNSLVLDSNGFPVVSYYDATHGDLKVLHCNDPDCSPGGDSITSPDTTGDVGLYTSIALDGSGYPVVSYFDFGNADLKLMHCNDPNCSGGGESIISPDTAGIVGQFTSLALDAFEHPVISYYDSSHADLKLMHCDDVNCAAGGESVTSPDTAGAVGGDSSLRLDVNGHPVIGYYDATNDALKVMLCDDVNCSSGTQSVTSPDIVGNTGELSLALDSNGRPVIAYYDAVNGDLKLMHCNDVNCSGGDESIVSPDVNGLVGRYPSLALDAGDNPAVSYEDLTNARQKILRCNDVSCSGGGETVTTPDPTGNGGVSTSIRIDTNGFPVASYFDGINSDLKVLHCGTAECIPPPSVGGIASQPVLTAGAGRDSDSNLPRPLYILGAGFALLLVVLAAGGSRVLRASRR